MKHSLSGLSPHRRTSHLQTGASAPCPSEMVLILSSRRYDANPTVNHDFLSLELRPSVLERVEGLSACFGNRVIYLCGKCSEIIKSGLNPPNRQSEMCGSLFDVHFIGLRDHDDLPQPQSTGKTHLAFAAERAKFDVGKQTDTPRLVEESRSEIADGTAKVTCQCSQPFRSFI